MRPQFTSCTSIVAGKIQRVADDHVPLHHLLNTLDIRVEPAVDVFDTPCGVIRGVVRPQFITGAPIIGTEIEGVVDERA